MTGAGGGVGGWGAGGGGITESGFDSNVITVKHRRRNSALIFWGSGLTVGSEEMGGKGGGGGGRRGKGVVTGKRSHSPLIETFPEHEDEGVSRCPGNLASFTNTSATYALPTAICMTETT